MILPETVISGFVPLYDVQNVKYVRLTSVDSVSDHRTFTSAAEIRLTGTATYVEPTETPTPEVTATPEVTETPEVTATPDPTEEPSQDITKEALKALIDEANALDPYAYPDFMPVMDALWEAQNVYDNANASQEAINKAYNTLFAAIEALGVTPTPTTTPDVTETPAAVDKTALNELIETTLKMDVSSYTEESILQLMLKLAEVKGVAENANATQAEVDAAIVTLNEAVKALVPKVTPTTTPNPTETEIPDVTEEPGDEFVVEVTLLDGTVLEVKENGTKDFMFGGTYPVLEATVPAGTTNVKVTVAEGLDGYDDKGLAPRNKANLPITLAGFDGYLLMADNGDTPLYFLRFVEAEVPQPTETEVPQPTETEAPQPSETPEVKEDVTTVFDDVYTDWYTDYVQYVYDNDLMTGIKGTKHFAPNANITKAQVAQVLYNMEGQPEVENQKVFTELNDVYNAEWYANAVAWAYNNGVVTGDLNTKKFNPNADVTREQLALMMFRYAKFKAYDVTATSDFAGLVGADMVADWSMDGVKWAVGAGLISGIEQNGVKDLAPQGNASRAQVAAILQRFCEAYK